MVCCSVASGGLPIIEELCARIRRWEIAEKDLRRTLTKHGQYQLIRNTANLTFATQLKRAGWQLAQPVFATSWKEPPTSRDDADRGSIADFFVGTCDWAAPPVGMLAPVMRGIMLADTLDLVITRYWRAISDHCPIAAYFTTGNDTHPPDVVARVTQKKVQAWMRFLRDHNAFLPQLSVNLEPADFMVDGAPGCGEVDYQSWDIEQALRQLEDPHVAERSPRAPAKRVEIQPP